MADKDSYIHLARLLPIVSVPPAQATTLPFSVVIDAYLEQFVKEEC